MRVFIYVASSFFAFSLMARANVNVHTFTPAVNPAYIYSEDALSNTGWSAHGQRKLLFNAFYDFVEDPLVELNANRSERRSTIVDSFNSLNLSAGYGVLPSTQVGASLSLSLAKLRDQSNEFGLGDMRLFAKVRLNNAASPVVFALIPELWVPTGRESLFISDGTVGTGVRLAAEHDFGFAQLVGNAGYRYSSGAQFRDLNLRSTVPLSLSVLVPITRKWAINGDATGSVSLPANTYQNPTNFYAGGRYRVTDDILAAAGLSIGALNRTSSAEYRFIAGVTITPGGWSKPASLPVPQSDLVPVSGIKKPEVEYANEKLVIRDDIKFAHNKATLLPSGRRVLDEVARVLLSNDEKFDKVIVEGHANELGTFPYNQTLSEARAKTVRLYLIGKGVSAEKLDSIGYGKTRPKAERRLPKERRLPVDRRVEFNLRDASG